MGKKLPKGKKAARKRAPSHDEALLSNKERRTLSTRANNLRYMLRKTRKERDDAVATAGRVRDELMFVRETFESYRNMVDSASSKYGKALDKYDDRLKKR